MAVSPGLLRGLRPDQIRFRADVEAIRLHGVELRQGDNIKELLRVLSLRKGRAETLTRRIHALFCALAAARIYRVDGWVSVEEVRKLDGWSRDGSTAKLVINEFELGTGAAGIVEQKGRGTDAQLRLRMPPALVEIGDLPDSVARLFEGERPAAVAADDVLPQPILDQDLAVAVAAGLRGARPDDLTLLVRPLYQGGNSSLVFGGLALRSLGSTLGRPAATSVLVKIPLGLSAGVLAVHKAMLDAELKLLERRAGWPGLPARVERLRVDLRSIAGILQGKYGVRVPEDSLVMDAMVVPLGHPRTSEAEPRLLSSVIDETRAPMRRLTRRDIHNVLTIAERLTTLTRLLHAEGLAHRRLSVDAIVVRSELGIVEHILAADLAASVATRSRSDDLLYRDLFDLGRVLVHVITGRPPSGDRQNFQPPDFPGREQIKQAVVGEGETVARLLFTVGRYLLEASPWAGSDGPGEAPTVRLLDHFLGEIEHINMLHWSRARGVPERRVSLSGPGGTPLQSSVGPREVWARSAADPVATRLVTISHLVDVATLRRWCERYVTSFAWQANLGAPDEAMSEVAIQIPSAERCIAILRRGYGRSAADEMWRYLWEAGPDEPVEKLVRVLRNYVTHWLREQRFDVAHGFGEPRAPDLPGESRGLHDELDALRRKTGARPDRQLLLDWIDELMHQGHLWDGDTLERRGPEADSAGRTSSRTPADRTEGYARLRSWMQAGALRRLLRAGTVVPTEKDIYEMELALHGRTSPETVFWHILLARAWVAFAAHGARSEAADNESGWDKAMRALLVAAGVAASRKLPVEMASTLSASAHLTRIALSTPELRAEFSWQGVDEESVRVQAAECALLAGDAYLWLDNQQGHCRSLREAAWLLLGSAFPERLVQALQLISLARNHRLLDWHPPQLPDRDLQDPSGAERFERYPVRQASADPRRFIELERDLFDEAHQAWAKARGRVRTSDDPGTVVAHDYFSRYAAGIQHHLDAGGLQIELGDRDDVPGSAVGRLFELVRGHYARPAVDRILDLGCGPGDEAKRLANDHEIWAVDSPVWFAASRSRARADDGRPGPRFIELDPVEYARRVCEGAPPEGSPAAVDVVLFRCSLCRVSQRDVLLAAAFELLRPGGLVVATDWVQTRTTDRITWSRLLDTGRFVDLETEPGYQRLCRDTGFGEFTSWDCKEAMHQFFGRRLDRTRRKLRDERSDHRRSPYERAFLLRAKRDLEVLTAMSTPRGPLGWLFWAARKPEQQSERTASSLPR